MYSLRQPSLFAAIISAEVYLWECICVSICAFQLRELTRAPCSLRRINQASATWPRWLWPSWAQLIRVPCGPDMRRTKKSCRSGRRQRTEGPAGNEWLWWLGPSCWPQHPPSPPTTAEAMALALAPTWTSDLARVGVGEVSPPGRVWPVSCSGWQEERRGEEKRDVCNRGWDRYVRRNNWKDNWWREWNHEKTQKEGIRRRREER